MQKRSLLRNLKSSWYRYVVSFHRSHNWWSSYFCLPSELIIFDLTDRKSAGSESQTDKDGRVGHKPPERGRPFFL